MIRSICFAAFEPLVFLVAPFRGALLCGAHHSGPVWSITVFAMRV